MVFIILARVEWCNVARKKIHMLVESLRLAGHADLNIVRSFRAALLEILSKIQRNSFGALYLADLGGRRCLRGQDNVIGAAMSGKTEIGDKLVIFFFG